MSGVVKTLAIYDPKHLLLFIPLNMRVDGSSEVDGPGVERGREAAQSTARTAYLEGGGVSCPLPARL